ncbi:restriction endonuclease subunit S [Caproicibacterium amylolyticum]|uniref:Restriction endonuclease subunit S n=1 Tax=Caproicibacterium amylolyticum TaxID=2766537 RepID=A0A7G9WGV0_9FIRM|nr:restriction endonuclease subunit S [Caproicibacterium amylolyticum]QNO17912.1 restriction endonuclease subunit S [Caproicibacterium amylolyticum]
MREMKDSGLQWLRKIPSNWELKKIKYTLKERIEKNNPIRTSDILSLTAKQGVIPYDEKEGGGNKPKEDVSAYRLAYPGDIVMNSMNILSGSVGLSRYFGCVSPVYYMLRPYSNEDDVRYFNYIFQTTVFQKSLFGLGNGILIKESGNGKLNTIRMRIPMDKFGNLVIPVATAQEQRIIADILDNKCSEIDSLIADIQSQIDTLEQYKRSVITEAVTKGLNLDAKLKDSGIPWCPVIPSHWSVTNPKALFYLRTQRAMVGDRQLTASQKLGIVFQDEFMEMENQKVVTVEKDFGILKHVEPNDFVISMRSFQGGLEYSEQRGCISSAYVMLIPNKDKVYPPFFRWFFKSNKYINALQSTTNLVRDGQALRYANFVKVPLFIIPTDEQKQIAQYLNEKCNQIDAVLEAKREQLTTLEEYKKSLIYEYVTGKKEVVV